ncbi:MAG: hypothetical protein QM669_05465 [Siphonobacter sp.]
MSRKNLPYLLAGFLLLIPISTYFLLLNQYALNIPKWDDHGLRAFIDRTDKATSVGGFLYAFWRQHNEHRIVYDRLISFFDYKLTGKLNFVHLMWVGNAALPGIVLVWLRATRKILSPLYLVPTAFFIFTLAQWENMYWGMASLQNFGVLFWCFGCFYFLVYRPSIGIAVGMALLALCTSGNGLLAGPIGILVLLVMNRKKDTIWWIICTLFMWGIYFWGYVTPERITAQVDNKVVSFIRSIFLFVGSAGDVFWPRKAMMLFFILGIILVFFCLLIALQFLRKFVQRTLQPFDYFSLGIFLFILGTIGMVALGRIGSDENVFSTSRYKIYSVLLLCFVYLWVVYNLPKRFQWMGVVAGYGIAFFYWAGSNSFYYADTIRFNRTLQCWQFNWTDFSKPQDPNAINDPAPAFYDTCLTVINQPAQDSLPIKLQGMASQIVFTAQATHPDDIFNSYYLFKSAQKNYLFPMDLIPNGKRFFWPSGFKHFQLTSVSSVAELEFKPGRYEILVLKTGPTCQLYHTNQMLTITERPEPKPLNQNW